MSNKKNLESVHSPAEKAEWAKQIAESYVRGSETYKDEKKTDCYRRLMKEGKSTDECKDKLHFGGKRRRRRKSRKSRRKSRKTKRKRRKSRKTKKRRKRRR